ncbi:MAG: hypothetical protein OXH79_01585 [Boseongicola sp.]|nr:hypothetical protein [Boseongicola sp.]
MAASAFAASSIAMRQSQATAIIIRQSRSVVNLIGILTISSAFSSAAETAHEVRITGNANPRNAAPDGLADRRSCFVAPLTGEKGDAGHCRKSSPELQAPRADGCFHLAPVVILFARKLNSFRATSNDGASSGPERPAGIHLAAVMKFGHSDRVRNGFAVPLHVKGQDSLCRTRAGRPASDIPAIPDSEAKCLLFAVGQRWAARRHLLGIFVRIGTHCHAGGGFQVDCACSFLPSLCKAQTSQPEFRAYDRQTFHGDQSGIATMMTGQRHYPRHPAIVRQDVVPD